MGLLSSIGGVLGLGGGSEKSEASSKSESLTPMAMARPSGYDEIFSNFLNIYLGTNPAVRQELDAVQAQIDRVNSEMMRSNGNTASRQKELKALLNDKAEIQKRLDDGSKNYGDQLNDAYREQAEFDQGNIAQLESLINPLTSAMRREGNTHSGLLTDILNKRMAGEAFGDYGADIDKLLGERTEVSFGGGEPMKFITGQQRNLIGDLLNAQETAIGNMANMSQDRYNTNLRPDQTQYDLGREVVNRQAEAFNPSNIGQLKYLDSLRSLFEPMEQLLVYGGSGTPLGTASGDSMSRGWNASIAGKAGV